MVNDGVFSGLSDRYGRKLTYLRLSVTDRCNLRCVYCAPQADFSPYPQDHILSFEEMVLVCRAFVKAGVKKIRITGGEPLVRRDIARLVRSIAEIDGVEQLCMTTNGVLLGKYADELYDAGVRHLNISLDTFDREKYRRITGRDEFVRVWNGINMVMDRGFGPVKINCVVMRGINDDELVAMAKLTRDFPVEMRFIEFMQVGQESSWRPEVFMSCDEAKQLIENRLGNLESCDPEEDGGPASIFSAEGWKGRIGFISPLSKHFCAGCNRVRMTPDGRLRLCLFSDEETDVRSMLRKGTDVDALAEFFLSAVARKPEGYEALSEGMPSCSRRMSGIGG